MLRVLLYQRFPYYRFIADFAEDFRQAGHQAEWLPASEGPRLREHVARFRPDFVFCIGASTAVATVLAGRVPLVFYELDKILNPTLWSGVPAGDQDSVFTTYREDVALFRGFGFQHVHYLPFCPNLRRDYPVRLPPQPAYPVSFIGAIVRSQTNDYRQLLQHARSVLPEGAAQRRLFEEMVRFLETVLADQENHFATHTERISARFAKALPPAVDAALRLFRLHGPTLANTVAKEAAHRQRLFWLSQFEAVHLWGPEAPDPPLPGAIYHGSANQYEQSGPLFAASAVNFHLQRLYAQDGLSDRVFNVLAAGGCLLADANPALLDLFAPGVEIETYAGPAELRAKCERLLRDGPYRQRLAIQGQRCVRDRHLFRHRLETMIRLLPFGPAPLVGRAIATTDAAIATPAKAAAADSLLPSPGAPSVAPSHSR